MRFEGGPWLSYGEVDRRSNRVANALIARGLRKGEAVSTLMPNIEENLATWFGIQKAGGVQCPINLAYRGDFLSWVLNLPRSRFLVVGDHHLAVLARVMGDLAHLEHVIVVPTGEREGPDPGVRWESVRGVRRRARRRPGRGGRLDRRRARDVHLGHHRSLEGRHQAARLGLLQRPHLQRGVRGDLGGHLLHVPAAVPLERPGARHLPGDDRRCAHRLRVPVLLLQVLGPGGRRRRDHPEHRQRHQLLHLEHGARRPRPGPHGVADHGDARAEGHLPGVPGALRHPLHRGLRAHRDRHGHVPPTRPAGPPGQLRHRDAGLRGDRGRARHRPAGATRACRARSSWT